MVIDAFINSGKSLEPLIVFISLLYADGAYLLSSKYLTVIVLSSLEINSASNTDLSFKIYCVKSK